jgi:hypothetical protein
LGVRAQRILAAAALVAAALSAFAGMTTGFGPLYLGFGAAPGGVFNAYFQLGRPF